MRDISLKNDLIKLEPVDEEKISKVLENFKETKNIHMILAIKRNNTEEIIGYIYSYNYNKIDNYEYINIVIDDENCITQACSLFLTYIFTCFPIRKVYYQGDSHNKCILLNLKKIGFELEANLKSNYFFEGEYRDLYILAIFRENFVMKG